MRKQSEKDLKQARDNAEAANQAKSTFLANMSHELRTPLHAILGFSRLLGRESDISAEQHGRLEIINRSGEHLLGMVDDILSLAKIEAGRVELKQEMFDIMQLVQEVGQMMKSRAEGKGLRFTLELDPALPPYVQGDAGKLRQVHYPWTPESLVFLARYDAARSPGFVAQAALLARSLAKDYVERFGETWGEG